MLRFSSLTYLALPWFLFALGWLRWPYAAALGLILGISLVLAARAALGEGRAEAGFRGTDAIFVVVLAALLAWVSGAGGLCVQEWDWTKHNAVLHDLTVQPWPVSYAGQATHPQPSFLTYYIAYYLPAAAVGKLAGLRAAELALLAWTFLGLLLVSAWLARLVRRGSWLIFAGWFLLSGMDVIGACLRLAPQHVNLEWWAGAFQYSSNLALLLWVPQHALPGWIAAALLLESVEQSRRVQDTVLATALTGLWSPFVTIGLVPLLLAGLCRRKLRPFLGWSSLIAAPALVAVAACYLGSVHVGGDLVPIQWTAGNYSPGWFVTVLVTFLTLEVAAFALLVGLHLRSDSASVPGGAWNLAILGTAVLALTVLPGFRVGTCNDLVMRASIPCLAALWIVLIRTVGSPLFRLGQVRSSLLALCLLIGAITPITLLGTHLATPRFDARSTPPTSIFDVGAQYVPQYLGDPHSMFYEHLARTDTPDEALARRD